VIVLVGALATGGSWVRSVGEGYQLASLPAEAPAAEAAPALKAKSPLVEPVEVAEIPLPAPVESATESPAAPVDVDLAESAPEPAEDVPAPAAEPDAVASPVRLATGQELGGRIVSVKSENVSLEWSSDSD
jgi:uncharacterized membrane protein